MYAWAEKWQSYKLHAAILEALDTELCSHAKEFVLNSEPRKAKEVVIIKKGTNIVHNVKCSSTGMVYTARAAILSSELNLGICGTNEIQKESGF